MKRKTMTWAELQRAKQSLNLVAKREGKTLEEVRSDVKRAIAEARSNPDPAVRARWALSPFSGREPSPEEFVAWCAKMAQGV